METGFLLSYGAFVADVIVFVIAVFQTPWKSASDEKRTRIRIALVLAVLGLVALTSPASFIVSYPDSLKTAHPISWGPAHRGFQYWKSAPHAVGHGYAFQHGGIDKSPLSLESLADAPPYLQETLA
jgi:hypothetical protein